MAAGYGRQPRRAWEAKDLATEFRTTDHAVRNWCRGDNRPDRTKAELLLKLFTKGEQPGEARSLAARFWEAYGDRAEKQQAELTSIPAADDLELHARLEMLAVILEGEACVQNPFARQKASHFRKCFLARLDWCQQARVERRMRIAVYLAAFERQAEEYGFLRYFEAEAIRAVLAHLGAPLTVATPNQGRLVNAWAENEKRYERHVRPLLDAIEQATRWLDGPTCTLPARERPRAGEALRDIEEQVSDLEIDVAVGDAARARLERYEPNQIRRTVLLTQSLLGQDAALLPPRTVFRDLPEPWCPEMVVIPAGEFLMRSPEGEEGRDDGKGPQHLVRVPSFVIGRYPVTFAEYDQFCERTGREKPKDESWGRGRMPVINVSWEDARAYCRWLSGETRQDYRLPSEAEWEYACQAGTASRYWRSRRDLYNVNDKRTTEVGQYGDNPWCLYDMLGNVWEWCEDLWHESYAGAPLDGSPWLQGGNPKLRVVRGGSWIQPSWTSKTRDWNEPGLRHNTLGFRVARTLIP